MTSHICRESSFTDYEDAGISTKQVLDDLSEIERDLQLRRLLWESSDEWGKLVADWTITQFDELNVDVMQKNVSKFTQTVFMLEKGKLVNWLLSYDIKRTGFFMFWFFLVSSTNDLSIIQNSKVLAIIISSLQLIDF